MAGTPDESDLWSLPIAALNLSVDLSRASLLQERWLSLMIGAAMPGYASAATTITPLPNAAMRKWPRSSDLSSHLVFANLKTWLTGIHHGVSSQHLQAYLNEFTFRFNRRFYPFNALRSLVGMAGGMQAPTFAELYSGNCAHPTCSRCLR
jgi:hypothetical protein